MNKTALRALYAQGGFTVVELIVVMIIIGALAITGLSKFSSASAANERSYTDHTLSALHYAHRLATVGGCDLRVQMSGGVLTLSSWATCSPATHTGSTSAIDHPDNSGAFVVAAPAGVSTGTLDIYFDSRGRPHTTSASALLSSATTLAIGDRTLIIEAETGYVYE